MEPFNFIPTEIICKIIDLLTYDDIKNLFTLSKSWNNCIGTCGRSMKKIKLNITSFNLNDVVKIITNTQILHRKYQHLQFSMSNYDSIIQHKCRIILNYYSDSIVSISTTCDIFFTSPLPKLKDVSFLMMDELRKLSNGINHDGLLSNIETIENLTFISSDSNDIKLVAEFLLKLNNLKYLCLEDAEVLNIYFTNQYNFRLTTFLYTGYSKLSKNVRDLLIKNQTTLAMIQYGEVTFEDMATFLLFPNLKTLKVLRCAYAPFESHVYSLNLSITSLSIEGFYATTDNLNQNLTNLLKVLKNIEVLVLSHLDGTDLDSLFQINSLKLVKFDILTNVTKKQKMMMMVHSKISFVFY
ncbi:hypothetical protein ACKWTF_016571 [Chironomus riparius]